MPKQRKNELIVGSFFYWKLFQRSGVYRADGRTNLTSAGRHSLGTKSHQQALENLRHLDAIKAIELGLADESILDEDNDEQLPLGAGVELYRAHVQRPAVTGGASEQCCLRPSAHGGSAIETSPLSLGTGGESEIYFPGSSHTGCPFCGPPLRRAFTARDMRSSDGPSSGCWRRMSLTMADDLRKF